MGGLVVLAIAGAVAFTVVEPIQVLPRVRLSPGYSLLADDGSHFTSEDARGSVTLYAFAPTDCGTQCDAIDATMREVERRVAAEVDLGDTPFQLVTIALDENADVEQLRQAAERSGSDGASWRWVGGEADEIRTVVGSGFGRYFEALDDGTIRFDPGFVLVDGLGLVRGEYHHTTGPSESADTLVAHVDILADELRYNHGAASVAYEAAHLFLCYP